MSTEIIRDSPVDLYILSDYRIKLLLFHNFRQDLSKIRNP